MQALNTQRHATDTDRDGGLGVVRFGASRKAPCNTVEAPECAVPVLCVSFYLGWGGFGIQDTINLHDAVGTSVATASSQQSSTKH